MMPETSKTSMWKKMLKIDANWMRTTRILSTLMIITTTLVGAFRNGVGSLKPHLKTQTFSSQRLSSKGAVQCDEKSYIKLSRLFIPDPLNSNSLVKLQKEDTNYVLNVMRMKNGSPIRVFNPQHGEFLAELICGQRDASLRIMTQLRIAPAMSSLFPSVLFFAPIKKTRLKTLFEKATELGVEHIVPVVTQNTQYLIEPSSMEQYRKVCVQSAEQCERLTLPVLHNPISLATLMDQKHTIVGECSTDIEKFCTLPLLVCAERMSTDGGFTSNPEVETGADKFRTAQPLLPAVQSLVAARTGGTVVAHHNSPLFGVFVGPEGGFTATEIDQLAALDRVRLVSLGRTVLRAETASIYALSVTAAAADATYESTCK